MSKKTELGEKHWKALKLLEDGNLSRKEIATACGWSADHFDRLCCGNVEKCGYTASLFKEEYLKIQKKQSEETQLLVKENMRTAHRLMGEVFAEISAKKKKTPEDKKILSMYANAIAKCQPSVNIKNLSYSYTQGLNPEDLIREFKRLETIASQSFDRRGVSEVAAGRSGAVSSPDEPGD